MQSSIAKHMARARRGFSLVELVIVIIIIAILAVAVFAGGSITVKKSQVSRTISDLHNFSIAVEATLNEMPDVANITVNELATGTPTPTKAKWDALLTALNANLPADYQLAAPTDANYLADNNITKYTTADGDGIQVWQSAKTDSWGNPYFVIFNCEERNSGSHTEFFVTVVSAGPNAKTSFAADGEINADDIFNLTQYTDGDVTACTYNWAEPASTHALQGTKGTPASAATTYNGSTAPVNFQVS